MIAGEAVYVDDFGALGDGVTDDSDACQAAVNYAQSHGGGAVRFGRGKRYLLSKALVNDRTPDPDNIARVSFVGDDAIGSTLLSAGSGSCIIIRNSPSGSAEPNVSNQTIARLTILGPGYVNGTRNAVIPENSYGIELSLGSMIRLRDLRIQSFDYALHALDTDQAQFDNIELRFNNHAVFGAKNSEYNAASTQPNNWVFTQCGIGSNYKYGIRLEGGSTLTYVGGIIASNGFGYGAGTVGYGVYLKDSGFEGGVGATFVGTYFEANNGIADVVLEASATYSPPITQCVHNFIGCSFNRIDNDHYSISSILTNFGAVASVGQQRLNIEGCSFKSLGAYQPVAGRPYIAFNGLPANKDNFYERANIYEDAIETPHFIGQGNLPWLKISRSANLALPNATDTLIPMDTIQSQLTWFGAFSGGGVVIPETGTYIFSAVQVLTTQTQGFKRLRVKVDGVIAASGVAGSVDDTMALSGLQFMAQGQVITLEARQETMTAMTLAGSSIAHCFFMIRKVA